MSSQPMPKWYHGTISREDAEARIYAARAKNPGVPLFLIRKSAKDLDHYVLSCMQPKGDSRCNHIICQVTAGNPAVPASFTLQTGNGVAQPSFGGLEQLIDHYRKETSAPPAPLGAFVAVLDASDAAPASAAAPAPAAAPAAPAAAAAPAAPSASAAATMAPVGRNAAVGSSQQDSEDLLIEGYLTKRRGVGQSRTRFFRLTSDKLTYFTKEAGEMIASVLFDDIASISDLDKTSFRVVTREPFGQSHKSEMILEAPNQRVKNRWLVCFRGEDNTSGGMRAHDGKLLIEGYLSKTQTAMTSADKTRWFVCTSKHFAYYKDEAGELMGSVPLDNITSVSHVSGDEKAFKVIANTRFTTTGSYEVACQCESEASRNKWLAQMSKAIPDEKFPH